MSPTEVPSTGARPALNADLMVGRPWTMPSYERGPCRLSVLKLEDDLWCRPSRPLLACIPSMEDRYGSGVGSPGRGRIDDVLERTDLGRLLDELAEPAEGALRGRRWHCPLAVTRTGIRR